MSLYCDLVMQCCCRHRSAHTFLTWLRAHVQVWVARNPPGFGKLRHICNQPCSVCFFSSSTYAIVSAVLAPAAMQPMAPPISSC